MKRLILLLTLLFVQAGFAAPSLPIQEKYIIAFGGTPASSSGTPTPQDMLASVDVLKKVTADGLVINVSNLGGFYGNILFVKPVPSLEQLQPEFDAYAKLNRGRGATNHDFIRVDTAELTADWYDDKTWDMIIENARSLGKVMAKMGVRGIMFDDEAYLGTPFNYKVQLRRTEYSYGEYCAEVRKRGRQMMAAVAESVPDAIVFMTMGPHSAWQQTGNSSPVENSMGLVPAFTRGMEEGAPQGKVIDGFETSYMYRSYKQFKESREWMTSRKVNAFPGYDGSHPVGVGFGNWLHLETGTEGKLDMVDFKKNSFTPEEWEYALSYALSLADEYIWVYSVPWATLPDAYRNALAAAKKPHALDFKPLERSEENKVAEYIGTAKGRPDALDSVVFAPLHRTHEELFDFPKVWKFSFDPKNLGQKEGWFKPDHSLSDWQDMRIDNWWEPQVKHNYFGSAWYRIEFTPPSSWKDRKPLLCFGAVNGDAHVYLNGKLLGAHMGDADGWDTPFEVPLDGKLRWDQPNTLVVHVVNLAGLGGIWKSVKIFAPKMSSGH